MMSYEEKEQAMQKVEGMIHKEVYKLFNYMQSEMEDLIQDAKLLVFEKLDKYDSSKGELTTFCYQVLHKNLVDLVKKKYRVWYKTDKVESDELDKMQDEVDYTTAYLFDRLSDYISRNKNIFTKRELAFLELFLETKNLALTESTLGMNKNNTYVLIHKLKAKMKKLIELDNK